MKNTKIISAFPACGKSWFFENNKNNLTILDSDSSNFSWVLNEETNTKTRNPDFPANYINHIKENIGKADFIFVSSHDVVRKALKDEGIDFAIVLPKVYLKDAWVERCAKRGSDEAFCKLISDNWKSWIIDMESDIVENERPYYILERDEYLSDAIEYLKASPVWHITKLS